MALVEAASCSPVSIGQFIAEPPQRNWGIGLVRPDPNAAGTVTGNQACIYTTTLLLHSVGCSAGWEGDRLCVINSIHRAARPQLCPIAVGMTAPIPTIPMMCAVTIVSQGSSFPLLARKGRALLSNQFLRFIFHSSANGA